MTEASTLLTTLDMARFVTDGVLRFDAVVPDDINRRALDELPDMLATPTTATTPMRPRSGTPLEACFEPDSAVWAMLRVPEVAGAIRSLVGDHPTYDHHFVHFNKAGNAAFQHLHADAVIDTGDPSFDIQVLYFPHDVEAGSGGTRYVPGSHLRNVHENSIARYQHISGDQFFAGPAGTVLIFHHGLWHAGQANPSDTDRWMFKLRLNPTRPQIRLWDTSDYASVVPGNWDHSFATTAAGPSVPEELRRTQAWSFTGESRIDLMQRIALWRYLADDPDFDVDWYYTRIESRSAFH